MKSALNRDEKCEKKQHNKQHEDKGDPATGLAWAGVPADLRDAQGRNVLFYAVKEALPQLTAFLLGSLDVQRRLGLHHD